MGSVFKHYLFSAFAMMLAIFFFVEANDMPRQAALFPKLISGLVAVFSVLMAVNAYRDAKRAPVEEANYGEGRVNVPRVVVFVGLVAAYIYLIPRVGYFIMTPLFILGTYIYLKAISPIKALVISLGFTAFIYGLFVSFLKLPIPMGFLESILGN